MPSLRKRRYRSGKTAWVIYYRVNGKSRIYTIGDVSKKEAMRVYHQFCASFEKGTHPLGHASQKFECKHRISDLVKEYLAYSQATKAENTCRIIREAFRDLLLFAGDLPLDSVGLGEIERFKAWRLSHVKPVTFNFGFRALKAGFEYAVRLGWLHKNPFKLSKQVPVPESDYPKYLTIEEVKRLLSVIIDVEFRRFVRFYLYTGCRRSEAASLDWQDVDLKARIIIIRSQSTKSRKNRVIQVGEKLYCVLKEQSPRSSGRVFPKWGPSTISKMFKGYVEQCGFGRKITIHSLRHTATVHWLLAGVDIHTVSKILGHTSIRITETVYAHVPAAQRQEAMDKLPY